MGHKNKKTLKAQAYDKLQGMLRPGESRHAHKIAGDAHKYIFSYRTYKVYHTNINYFLDWCLERYSCKTLAECRLHADEWLQELIDHGYKASTITTRRSALAKFYGDSAADYIKVPVRCRADITRSRHPVARDAQFLADKYKDIIEFCEATGLRRAELGALTGDKLIYVNGEYYILVNKSSKGGRDRLALIIGNVDKIVAMMRAAGAGKVFAKVPNGMDIHSHRAGYAATVYLQHARPVDTITDPQELYRCRKDYKGLVLDRQAMMVASQNLGHGRIGVISQSYLWRLPYNR